MSTEYLLSGRPSDWRWLCETQLNRRDDTCLQECHTEAKQEHHKLEVRPRCAEKLHENEAQPLPSQQCREEDPC